MIATREHICFQQIEFAAANARGFSDVSILTAGEAQGHGLIVDERTIDGFMQAVMGKTMPAYLTHSGASEDRLGGEIGMFSGFYRDGQRVRAKNFNFLQSFMQASGKAYSTLVELASGFPDQLGISPVLRYMAVWPMTGGIEMPADDMSDPPEGCMQAMPSMRVTVVKSCDFVQQPAANVGLFHARVDDKTTNNPTTMTADTILLSKHTEALTAKEGEIAALSTQHKDAIAALEAKHKTSEAALQAKADETVAQLAVKTKEIESMTSALAAKTKEADDAGKYDMRKAGAPALEIALQAHTGARLPEPKATDAAKWEQYTELCEAQKDGRGNIIGHLETAVAKAFKAKFLTKK